MLENSVLGKLYHFWTCSLLFSLLQRIYRPVAEQFRRSRILQILFREGRAERAFRNSRAAGFVEGCFALAKSILRHFSVLAAAWENSAVVRIARGSILRPIVSFEGLFGAFLFVMFVTPHKYWNNLYTVLAAFGFFIVYLLLAAAGRRRFASPKLLGPGALLFLLALLLSLGFTADLRDSLRILLFFLASFALCYVIAADFQTPEKLRELLCFLYCALLVISLYAIAQRAFHLVRANASFTDLKLNVGMPGRVYSTLDNPINLSEFILLFLPLSAAFAAGVKRPLLRLVLVAGLVCPAVALVLTYSRGGWIAICIAAAVFLWCRNKRIFPVLILLAVIALPLLPSRILARIATIGNTKDTSTRHRLDIWQGTLRMVGDHGRVFTGIGLGPDTFQYYYPFYSQGTAKVGAYHSQLHYLELILETGLLGLLSFLYMMVKYVGRAIHSIRSGLRENRLILIACVSSVAALAFVGLVEYLWFYQRIMFAFFIFLGIMLAAAGTPAAEES